MKSLVEQLVGFYLFKRQNYFCKLVVFQLDNVMKRCIIFNIKVIKKYVYQIKDNFSEWKDFLKNV